MPRYKVAGLSLQSGLKQWNLFALHSTDWHPYKGSALPQKFYGENVKRRTSNAYPATTAQESPAANNMSAKRPRQQTIMSASDVGNEAD